MAGEPVDIWESVATSLDIGDSLYDDAVQRYECLGEWLSRPESGIAGLEHIYAQGSFALGTVVRPLSDNDEYDIDLISEVGFSKQSVTQKILKEKVGAEVEKYHDKYGFIEPLTEGDCCWTLQYADNATFKMDIVPAVPEVVQVTSRYADNPIAITDRNSPTYAISSPLWKYSDPLGYAAWFKSRMLIQLNERRNKAAQLAGKRVDEVPEHRIKTPLQRAVQLLKRHRNIYFAGERGAPPSIIITTLAALVYSNESDIAQALAKIIVNMEAAVQRVGSAFILPNPVDPRENLVRSWNGGSTEAKAFFDWCTSLKKDLVPALVGSVSSAGLRIRAGKSFGERIVEKASELLGKRTGETVGRSAKRKVLKLPEVFCVRHRVWPRWSFRYEYDCTVTATMRKDGKSEQIASDSTPLPKFAQLEFSVETDTPLPYQAFYQVVNTGEEARQSNGLRGGIVCKSTWGAGKFAHDESTKYTGPHYIEFFILKNGVCVSRSGHFIVNIV